MVRRKMISVLSFFIMTSLLLGTVACSQGSPSSGGTEPTPTPIPTSIVPTNPTYTVQRGDVIQLLEFSGRIAPVLEQALFFKTSGYIDNVYVSRDDEVKAGDLIAELEMTDLKNQITQQEAELTVVQLDYDRRVAEARNSVRAAELNLAKLRASQSRTQVLRATISLQRAQENLVNAQDEYNKSLSREWEREEVRQGYADSLRNAQWNLEIAQAEYQDALLAQERNGYDIELSQMSLDMATMKMAEIETGLDITRTLLSMQRLTDQLNDARIVAPFDGIVVSTSLLEGKQIQGYKEAVVIADPTELEVSADLQDSEMNQLEEGMAVIAEFVNRPGETYTGVVRRLPYPYGGGSGASTSTDEDKTVRITLTGLGSDVPFVMGDRLRITAELERAEGTLWLPPQAVRTFEGRSFVVIQESGAQRRVDVRLGIKSTNRVEILEGLTEGQVVIAP